MSATSVRTAAARAATVRETATTRVLARRLADRLAAAATPKARLRHVSPDEPGITRRRAGSGWSYRDPAGRTVRDPDTLERIRRLVIPPAWTDVWICAHPGGHLQATGVDQRGRRQYLYHPDFRARREAAKFEHLLEFAEALPVLRERVREDLARPGLGREKVLAVVVRLLETTMIRVGSEAYARENGSYGLASMRSRHVAVDGAALAFHFKGKSGKEWRVGVRDRRLARVVRACQDLPGQHLFQYVDAAGERQPISSGDVNAYLKAASGRDITAKDFRTWWGTVLAATALADPERGEGAGQARLAAVVREVSRRLGNTPAVCRKGYIHPEVITAHLAGELALEIGEDEGDGLSPAEAAVLAWLRRRLRKS
ncbi:DNA topoisomerase IB [Caulobacter sp. KR2-114]|uniref:DNA topoisomerase IB n=1 Tax=Caulobacter sp. KR2-114 TaxID=3400912 RepID=UPI003C0A2362